MGASPPAALLAAPSDIQASVETDCTTLMAALPVAWKAAESSDTLLKDIVAGIGIVKHSGKAMLFD